MRVTGLSVKDIVDMSYSEIAKLNERDLRDLSSRLVSTLNKRIRRMVASGQESAALNQLAREQGIDLSVSIPKFSVKGKKFNELRSQFIQMRDYAQRQTGSLRKTETTKGLTRVKHTYEALVGPRIFGNLRQERAFWKAYHRFMDDENMKELFPSNKVDSLVVDWLREQVEQGRGKRSDKLFRLLMEEVNRTDMDMNEKFQSFNGVSLT